MKENGHQRSYRNVQNGLFQWRHGPFQRHHGPLKWRHSPFQWRHGPFQCVMVPCNGLTMKGAVQPVKKLAGMVIIRIVRNTENIARRSG